MNSYNENLHSEIVTSLNNQEIELKKLKGQYDASLLSLYYAEGSRMTAAEKLADANSELKDQENISEQAVIDSDISTNVVRSATNAKDQVATTVTNTAVAAANVQIATNAIVKLASDTGSIYSIVQAANFGGEIYDQSQTVKANMDITAYQAELASQHSMEASATIAEVATSTVADKATATDTSIKTLLDTATAELTAATDTVTASSTDLATANNVEKKAEGDLETVNATKIAAEASYVVSNQELNLNLSVALPTVTPTKSAEKEKYTVSFNAFLSPFPKEDKTTVPPTYTPIQPVDNYYLFLVKNDAKKTFATVNAENIISKTNDTDKKFFIEISAVDDAASYSQEIVVDKLLDSDGEEFVLGDNYVVFMYANLKADYKKKINTFDNYLTAPSATFTVRNLLNVPSNTAVTPSGIPPTKLTDANTSSEDKGPQKLTFSVNQAVVTTKVDYRCIFLPDNKELTKGLLTIGELCAIEAPVSTASQIQDIEETITKLTTEVKGFESDVEKIIKKIEKGAGGKATPKSTAAIEKLKAEKASIDDALNLLIIEIEALEKKKEKLHQDPSGIEVPEHNHTEYEIPGFCFDLSIAEKIPAGSYTPAGESSTGTGGYSIELKSNMTDNFGNRLKKGSSYIPVILAISSDSEKNNKTITNALSDFKKTAPFKKQ
ncbi:hypothetical protein GCM10011344_35320 [Dokdonia pacifica]|uniref:Uncharacterized protein n=1 Tax=Dokdonia pacifica TaxID=1627892 RepID=A0A239AQQ0_9FLAO|nr:hypothetical protein [Dokdonia pacifica]GGG31330.1 hypothetical protein GCM10011344_35320 [Dokdonia pacifica]SNR98036.1 hypothetical protein SAMN06265376_10578 [Dokdonia pacifica]